MEKKILNEKIKEIIEKSITPEAKVHLQKVRKNNNVYLDSIVIHMPDSNISPTIYLDAFYKMYTDGVDMEEVAGRVLAAYYNGRPTKSLNVDFFKDFEKVKDRIVYRLVNAEKNKELLEEIPHILLQDLAICFYYAFHDEQLGDGSITIYNRHMEWWETNHQELLRLARENTPRLFPVEYKSLRTVIAECGKEIPDSLSEEIFRLYVVTNRQKTMGAACILYEGELEKITEWIGGNFYILPSSVHEVIVLTDNGRETPESLHKMIKEVNELHLMKEEVLSDYPYYYNRDTKKLTCLNQF